VAEFSLCFALFVWVWLVWVCFGVIYGYGCGCFQAWFGWLRSGVAPVALGLGDFSGGVVVLASPVMWGVVARC
jgi:hypothetical protein